MTYSLRDLAGIIEKLRSRGFRGVVIGSTVIQLYLGSRRLEDDVDFFAVEPSPLIEEDFYRGVAAEHGWGFSYTELGTPRIIARLPRGEVILEFYENIHDFYIPEEMLRRAPVEKVSGTPIQHLLKEDYVALKAKAGRRKDIEDLKRIYSLYRSGRLKIDTRLLREALQLLPEEDSRLAAKRLKSIGFPV